MHAQYHSDEHCFNTVQHGNKIKYSWQQQHCQHHKGKLKKAFHRASSHVVSLAQTTPCIAAISLSSLIGDVNDQARDNIPHIHDTGPGI